MFRILQPLRETFYFMLLYKQDQDLVKIYKNYKKTIYSICVLDGWQNVNFFSGNKEGREAAHLVSDDFPKLFLNSHIKDYPQRAQAVSDIVNEKLLDIFPKHVSCVGTFIFRFVNEIVIVSIGTINVFILDKKRWIKPDKLKSNKLNWRKYESGSSTFFGRGELRDNNLYSHKVDTLTVNLTTPILILTDGADRLIDLPKINKLFKKDNYLTGKSFVREIYSTLLKNKRLQNDDITVLLTSS